MTDGLLYTGISLDMLFMCALFKAARADLKRREIPDLYALLISVLGAAAAIVSASIVDRVLGLALAFPLIIPGLLGHMGGGDYKLLLAAGFYMGLSQSLSAMLLSLPAIFGAAVYLLAGKKTLKNVRIPLAPLIAFGCTGCIVAKWIIFLC